MKTTEFVSIGHPDKTSDYISQSLLDYCIQKDPYCRYAVQVMIKSNTVILGGQLTINFDLSFEDIQKIVKQAIYEVGYTPAYQKIWGEDNTISSENISVITRLTMQSPDISQGVNSDGWGDQGIFWGMAVNKPQQNYFPLDKYLAQKIGRHLYSNANIFGGLDIKTQVSVDSDDKITEVVVAIPMLYKHSKQDILNYLEFQLKDYVKSPDFKVIINGTGKYVQHGPLADCGITGRKLAVDFYGGNGRIGGGSPWTKDPSKADLTLNLYARYLAVQFLKENDLDEVHVSISCKIGQKDVFITYYDKNMIQIVSVNAELSPSKLIDILRLRYPIYKSLCKNGLFSIWSEK